MDNILFTIVKGIIFVFVLFASLYDTTYKTKEKRESLEKEKLNNEDRSAVTGVGGEYNKPVWYMFGILIALLIQNGVESITGATDDYKDNQWSLILMPMARYIIEFLAKGSVSYESVSVSNKF